MITARHVGVREFVEQYDVGMPCYDGIHIHLLESRALILEFGAGYGFEFLSQFGDSLATMCFNNADDHIFAAAVAPDSFAQHCVGLAHARCIAEKELERSAGLFGRADLSEPFFGLLGHMTSMQSGNAGLAKSYISISIAAPSESRGSRCT